ncbi:hypothetical protein EV356DRAFT_510002 [Viridothelium virens]|uniref:DUF7907 domain-containing protein n=1 Tax=Viridothelium virens TaxID=1048519 RepID=A0A6A6GX55_VIRVR|nr:hypothetical protein EV356DRAFT_510002 [Viridothelium virens]
MPSLALNTLLALLPTIAFSLPQVSPKSNALNTSQSYYLRTESTSSNTLFENLYVQSYHTGAGLSDVTLAPGPPSSDYAVAGFLNGSTNGTDGGQFQEFDLGDDFPWGMDMTIQVAYAGWSNVEINGGQGSAGFLIDPTNGLVYNNTAFGGWLVCPWWHSGDPQLFWYIDYYNDTIPNSCNFVNLIPEYF